MIKKLQVKLITVSMVSLTLVLAIIFGIANYQSYSKVVANADAILDLLAENGGTFPDTEGTSLDELLETNGYDSEEIPYESRYFTVVFENDGAVTSMDMGQIAAVNEETAEEYGLTVLENGKSRGFVEDYRYVVQSDGDSVTIIFLDCERLLYSFRTSLANTAIVALIGLITVFGLIFILSKRIIHPMVTSKK